LDDEGSAAELWLLEGACCLLAVALLVNHDDRDDLCRGACACGCSCAGEVACSAGSWLAAAWVVVVVEEGAIWKMELAAE
jgi:hypothetical protein